MVFRDANKLNLCNLMFDPSQFLEGRSELEEMMGYHALFDLQPRTRSVDRRLHLSTEHLEYTSNLIAILKSEYENQSEGRRLVLKLLVAFRMPAFLRRKAKPLCLLRRWRK